MSIARLGRIQFAIMEVLWNRGAATARQITDDLNLSHAIAHSTVQTLLRQLEDKAVVGHDVKNRIFVFKPLVNHKSVTRSATRELVERVFAGSAASLMAHLLVEERISEAELDELRALIESKGAA